MLKLLRNCLRSRLAGPARWIADMPVGKKITLFMVGVTVMSLLITGFISYRSISHDVVEGLGERLHHIADTANLMIDPADHEKIVDGYLNQVPGLEETPEFRRVQKALKRVHDTNELTSDLYTVIAPDWEGAVGNMIFITMSAEKTFVGNAMPLHPLVDKALKTGKTQFSQLYSDHEGDWVSAFTPILNTEGKPAAVLELDYKASTEVWAAKKSLIINLLIPAIIAMALSVLIGRFTGSMLSNPVVRLAMATKKVAGGDLDVVVDVQSRDELGVLGIGFNKMVFDLKRQRKELKDFADSLEQKVQARTAELAEANRNIAGMVNSVTQGFFMFNRSGEILGIYSKACLKLLECDPSGKKFWEVMRTPPELSEEVRGWVDLVFQDVMDWDSISGLGPAQINHSEGLYVTMQYFAVRDESGVIDKIVAVASDRTAERDANERAEREKRYAQMVVKLVKNRTAFVNFVRENLVARVEGALEAQNQQISEVFRAVHTFKSAAASFSLGDVAEYSHNLENELAVERKRWEQGESVDFERIRDRIKTLRSRYDSLLEEIKPLVGNALDKGDAPVEVGRGQLWGFARRLVETRGSNDPIVNEYVHGFLSEPIGKHLEHFGDVIQTAANKLGKEVNPLAIEGYATNVVIEPYIPVISSLIHAVRNAVDHGIEAPDERLNSGKKPTGTITISCEWERDIQYGRVLFVKVKDDGRGIDPNRIRAKLIEKGISFDQNATDEQVIQYIFAPGFSTAAQVTDISGRGVGMDAIKDAVTSLKGECFVRSKLGEGSILTIKLPEQQVRVAA